MLAKFFFGELTDLVFCGPRTNAGSAGAKLDGCQYWVVGLAVGELRDGDRPERRERRVPLWPPEELPHSKLQL